MRFLLTRPRKEAEQLAARLQALGHDSVISPVIEIACTPFAPPAADEISGLVITSRNALHCLARMSDPAPYTTAPLFAVGKACARLAKSLGFQQIITGAGKAADLVPLILDHRATRKKPLYHPGGRHKAFDMHAALAARGCSCIEQETYRAREAAKLSLEAQNDLETGALDAVILMSPRSAGIFAKLVNDGGQRDAVEALPLLCLSQNTANGLGALDEAHCKIAPTPDLEGMLALVASLFPPSPPS